MRISSHTPFYTFGSLTNISFSETDHQYVLITFVLFVIFLLIRSEDFEFNASKLHQPLAFVFTIIILSGGLITPFSIGESYWSMAYATPSDVISSSSTPALIYASNAASNLKFRVTDPQGQCVIGGTDDCTINESTKDNHGRLTSIMYADQVLRVRYGGADNALDGFSITSIDPTINQWTVSLETEDGGFQEAHASQEPIVKVKYRYHSETVTVFSN